jgi:hypothetical protein
MNLSDLKKIYGDMYMTVIFRKDYRTYLQIIREWWINDGRALLAVAVVIMTACALVRFSIEFYRLVWLNHWSGAIDLKMRYREVHSWFAGIPIYFEMKYAVYPPASYCILWPLLGWLPLMQARWLWGAFVLVMLGWLACLLVRESYAKVDIERVFIALLVPSGYAANVAIGNGQNIVYILPALITGLLLIRKEGKLHHDLLGAALILLTLVSPTIAAPFFWIVLFVPGRIRPAIFVVFGYVVLTLFASSFQEGSLVSLIQDWLEIGQRGAKGGSVSGGYSNVHSLLAPLGLKSWNGITSLIVLSVLGIWVYRYRRVDIWLLMGVTAIVARLWTYHRNYDDLLIILPAIALFRIVKGGQTPDGSDVIAGGLLAVAWASMLAPIRLLKSHPSLYELTNNLQLVVWLVILLFLLYQARREKMASVR